MKVVLVGNQRAGSSSAQALADVESVLSRLGSVSRIGASPSFASDLERETRGADLVVVAGGDGSLNWTLNALLGRLDELAFALIPMGTGNDLARSLGLPLQPVAAARAVVSAAEHEIDYGVASGAGVERLFVNACVGGFPVAVDEAVNPRTKDLLGPLAFWIAGLEALPEFERTTVTINGRDVPNCIVVGVGNGRTVGGGFAIFPEALLNDGMFDACALAVDDLASALRVLAHVRSGDHSGLDEVVEARSTRITIESDRPVQINVDGELLGLTTPAVFECTGRLRLRAPALNP